MKRKHTVLMGMLLISPFMAVCAAGPLSRLATGQSVKVSDRIVTIDSRFIDVIAAKPTRDEWMKNYWELIYFINLGHLPAISAGIDVLSTFPPARPYDDHDDPATLARALSGRDEFWLVLQKKPLATKKLVFAFFDKNPGTYVGAEGYQSQRDGVLKQD